MKSHWLWTYSLQLGRLNLSTAFHLNGSEWEGVFFILRLYTNCIQKSLKINSRVCNFSGWASPWAISYGCPCYSSSCHPGYPTWISTLDIHHCIHLQEKETSARPSPRIAVMRAWLCPTCFKVGMLGLSKLGHTGNFGRFNWENGDQWLANCFRVQEP